jgi:hypothetical protein
VVRIGNNVSKTSAADAYFPVNLVEESLRGFNILVIGPSKFLALPQSEGAYSKGEHCSRWP